MGGGGGVGGRVGTGVGFTTERNQNKRISFFSGSRKPVHMSKFL